MLFTFKVEIDIWFNLVVTIYYNIYVGGIPHR